MSNYKCPLSLEIIPNGTGRADVKLDIEDDHFDCVLSYIGDSMHDLIERVYYLYPDWLHDSYDYRIMEYYDEVEDVSTIDGVTEKRVWSDVPKKAEMIWDGEGSSIKWTLERPATIENSSKAYG